MPSERGKGFATLAINHDLQVAKKGRRILHFIDDQVSIVTSKEGRRIILCLCGLAGQVEADIGVVWKNSANKRSFARLARAGKHDDRARIRASPEHILKLTWNPHNANHAPPAWDLQVPAYLVRMQWHRERSWFRVEPREDGVMESGHAVPELESRSSLSDCWRVPVILVYLGTHLPACSTSLMALVRPSASVAKRVRAS